MAYSTKADIVKRLILGCCKGKQTRSKVTLFGNALLLYSYFQFVWLANQNQNTMIVFINTPSMLTVPAAKFKQLLIKLAIIQQHDFNPFSIFLTTLRGSVRPDLLWVIYTLSPTPASTLLGREGHSAIIIEPMTSRKRQQLREILSIFQIGLSCLNTS